MIGMEETARDPTRTIGEAPDDDEELLDEDLGPPPPAPLSRELTDAVDDAMAEARTAPKPVVSDAAARRLSSHSEI